MPDQSAAQVRRARFASQHLTDETRLGPSPADVASAICGVQAQVPAAAALAMRARSKGLVAEDVPRALSAERSIVRTWLMRGTLHVTAAQDVRWLLALFGPVFDAGGRRRRLELGLDEATCHAGLAVIRDVLGKLGPLTRHQILEHLLARGVRIASSGPPLIHLIAHAGRVGVICLGPPRGSDDTYVLLDDWVPRGKPVVRDAALAELARRYLAAYGPATEDDLATWSGLPIGDARGAIKAIVTELREIGAAGRTMWILTGRLSGAAGGNPVMRLLPNFDTYVLGYRDRDLMIAPEFTSRIQRGGGWLHPALAVDGWIIATWHLQRRKGQLDVIVEPFESLDQAALSDLQEEVADVSRFAGQPAELTIAGAGAGGA